MGVRELVGLYVLVVVVNCVLAGLVLWLAVGLWRWRGDLVRLTDWLRLLDATRSVATASSQVGLALVVRRSQLMETRLSLARLQLISRQLDQLLRLVGWLIQVGRWRRRSRL
ncbi:MAG: hypothetical protein AAF716_02710 [Cyanobacteria bacterium P01_D01_bin.1]